MLIYDVLNKEKVYRSVANDLRNMGVKHRLKKNAVKNEKFERNRNFSMNIFKVPLSYQSLDVIHLSSGAVVHVPAFVCQATTHLEKFLCQEGLFRKAGSQARQKDLIARINAGGTLGEKNHAIDVANCLKTFFRDLPEPLIPYAYHDLFVQCLVLRTQAIEALLLACILLPPLHLNTLAFFMSFLKKVSLNENLNKMSVENLATVIVPNIMPLQETTMSAVQTRLEAHLAIIKLLIENAEKIGILPKHISEAIAAEAMGSVETELDQSDLIPHLRPQNKRKKHRSGSLTRMFHGLKKIVGKNGSPSEAGHHNRELVMSELDPTHTPSIKIGKKRKVAETDGSVSVKKNPARETSPARKPKVRTHTTQKVHSEMRVVNKIERPRKIRLSLERLYSRSKQRAVDIGSDQSHKESYSPYIERRWSSASSALTKKKDRDVEFESAQKRQCSPLMRKTATFLNVRDDYDGIFMDADVNLSDECNEQTNQLKSDFNGGNTIAQQRLSSCRRSLDAIPLSETTGNCRIDYTTLKHDKNLRSNCRCLLSNELTKNTSKSLNESSIVNSCLLEKNSRNEEYVRIPKSEYEEIKNRVSAIESRISQEFGNIADESFEMMNSVSNVQNEYEKMLGEASIESILTADNLAKRLSKELKIRRSAEHKIIRSPSARKIGILRRRSQEKVPSRRVSRNASWHVTQRTEKYEQMTDNRLNNIHLSPKSNQEINNDYYNNIGDSSCSDKTNAKLNYLQEQLHTLITHTAEHAHGNCNSSDNFQSDDDSFHVTANKLGANIRRASSFHGNEFIDNSRYLYKQIKKLKKTNSQLNVLQNDNREHETPKTRDQLKTISWKDAAGYFKSDVRSNTSTPVTQSGRASIAKLRTQNAGMVLAKAKLFDDNKIRKMCNDAIVERKIDAIREASSKTEKIMPNVRESKNHETDTSPRKPSSTRRKLSKSPKNHNSKMKIVSSDENYSPIIKMEFTILPSQKNSRQITENHTSRRVFQKTEQKNCDTTRTSGKYENHKSCVKNTIIRNKINPVTYHDEHFSVPAVLQKSVNAHDTENNVSCKTPHIKRSLATKTPKSAKSLARRPIVDSRRTPLKAVPTLTTSKRQSPRNVLKSKTLTQSIN